MNIPTIFDWVEWLAPWHGLPAALAILALGSIILLIAEWRIALPALIGHYLVIGLLFTDLLPVRLAFVKVLVGLFACLILYLTARQIQGESPRAGGRSWQQLLAAALFQIFLIIIVALLGLYWAPNAQLVSVTTPDYVVTTIVFTMGLGLLTMGLARHTLQAGMGLLLVVSGGELAYHTLTQATALLLALAAITLLLAIAIAYLAQARARLNWQHS